MMRFSMLQGKIARYSLSTLLIGFSVGALATPASQALLQNTPYAVCFTPQQNCTALLVTVIGRATNGIAVQAYRFTSQPIATALIKAANRGVQVQILLDKSDLPDLSKQGSALSRLAQSGVSLWLDKKPAIAHNKVMIIDQNTVVTGSFNFTYSAQFKNAENMLMISSPLLAAQYLTNFVYRKSLSVMLSQALDDPNSQQSTVYNNLKSRVSGIDWQSLSASTRSVLQQAERDSISWYIFLKNKLPSFQSGNRP